MLNLPAVYVVHASDAGHHVVSLKKILQELIDGKSIREFVLIDEKSGFALPEGKIANGDMVILMLTSQFNRVQLETERNLKELKAKLSTLNPVGIIIDSVPYDSRFLIFPTDFLPIRSRADMDAIWAEIRTSLLRIYPVRQISPGKFSIIDSIWSLIKKIFWLIKKIIYLIAIIIALIILYWIGYNILN